MLDTWLIAPSRQFPMTSERGWKPPGLTCWLCFAPWIAWVCRLERFRNPFCGNCSNSMPIMRKLFGRWISQQPAWTATLCYATRWPH